MSEHLDHLDTDGLADLLAGVPAAGADEHVQECEDCAAALAELQSSLDQVSAALAGLPEPALPDGLAARLDSAVAKERRALSGPAATNVVPLAPRQVGRRRRLPPVAGGIAAAAALVLGGVVLAGSGGAGSRSASNSASSGVTASNPTAGIATSNSGRTYAKNGAGLAALLPGLLKGGVEDQRAPAAAAAPAPASGTQVPKSTAGLAVADPLAALRTNAGLAQCLVSLTDPNDPGVPLALDYGTYAGTPALVVVLPSPVKDKVYVYFVGAGCSAKDSQVLFFDKLTKP